MKYGPREGLLACLRTLGDIDFDPFEGTPEKDVIIEDVLVPDDPDEDEEIKSS